MRPSLKPLEPTPPSANSRFVTTAPADNQSVIRALRLGAKAPLTRHFGWALLRARVVNCLEIKRLRDAERLYLIEFKQEQDHSDALLRNVVPDEIADRLKQAESTIAAHFPDVTLLFANLVSFIPLAAEIEPDALVEMLNTLFSKFDQLVDTYGLEKIKTIGDAYRAVSGLLIARSNHVLAAADPTLAMDTEANKIIVHNGQQRELRCGIHSGPVIAGIIGEKKFSYDLWGDTVNIASRLQSMAQPGSVMISDFTRYKLAKRLTARNQSG